MSRTATVRARVEPDLKEDVEQLLHRLGLNATDAINLFYSQIRLRPGLPFQETRLYAVFSRVFKLVPGGGLEPPRCCHRQILSLLRLPFRHPGGVTPKDNLLP